MMYLCVACVRLKTCPTSRLHGFDANCSIHSVRSPESEWVHLQVQGRQLYHFVFVPFSIKFYPLRVDPFLEELHHLVKLA